MKRFTETEKWVDPWFKSLSMENKVAWLYFCDTCDNAGIWHGDFELMSFQLKTNIDKDKVLGAMQDRLVAIDDGKYFIRSFIRFQFGHLSTASRFHKRIIESLNKHKIKNNYLKDNYNDNFLDTLPDRVPDTVPDRDKEWNRNRNRNGIGMEQEWNVEDSTKTKREKPEVTIDARFNFLEETYLIEWISTHCSEVARNKMIKTYKPKFLKEEIEKAFMWNDDQPPSKKKKKISSFLSNWFKNSKGTEKYNDTEHPLYKVLFAEGPADADDMFPEPPEAEESE